MTVEELIDELRVMPQTASVVVWIEMNENSRGELRPLVEWREATIESVDYDLGIVNLELSE